MLRGSLRGMMYPLKMYLMLGLRGVGGGLFMGAG
jgi:hypothetical protein